MKQPWPIVVVAGLTLASSAGCSSSKEIPPSDGVEVSFRLDSSPEREEAIAAFQLKDVKSGKPIANIRPLAWMALKSRGAPDPVSDGKACRRKIATFLKGHFSTAPDLDMNSYTIWALNDDQTISVINPQIAFSKTKLKHLIALPGRASDWAVHPKSSHVFVLLPLHKMLLAIDAKNYQIASQLKLPASPHRLLVSPDGRKVFVSSEKDHSLTVVDARTLRILRSVPLGKGRHDLAFSRDGKSLLITNTGSRWMADIDAQSGMLKQRIRVPTGIQTVVTNPTKDEIYLLESETGMLRMLGSNFKLTKAFRLSPDVTSIGVDPSGRWIFALNRRSGKISACDRDSADISASKRMLIHELGGLPSPSAVVFTRSFAYIHDSMNNTVGTVDLRNIAVGQSPVLKRFQAGRPSRPTKDTFSAKHRPISPNPEGNGVIVASASDRTLYFHTDGMTSPAMSHTNYGHKPRSVAFVDHSLRETAPGIFETSVKAPIPGDYSVAILVPGSQVSKCLNWTVQDTETPRRPASRPKLRFAPQFDSQPLKLGIPVNMDFTLAGENGSPPVPAGKIVVLLVQFPNGARWTLTPTELKPGVFRVKFKPTRLGEYKFLVGVPALSIGLNQFPPTALNVIR